VPAPLVPRLDAIAIVETDRAEVMELISRLPPRALTTRGLGGGDWSPKDLLGHLESWEEYALQALDAWSRNEKPPLQVAFETRSLDQINEDAVVEKASRPTATMLASAEATHEELLQALRSMSDRRWAEPPTRRHRAPVGRRLGGILAGVSSPFTHDAAHLPDLRAFVDERGR
jgi:Protein of unknown function (DUF1706)